MNNGLSSKVIYYSGGANLMSGKESTISLSSDGTFRAIASDGALIVSASKSEITGVYDYAAMLTLVITINGKKYKFGFFRKVTWADWWKATLLYGGWPFWARRQLVKDPTPEEARQSWLKLLGNHATEVKHDHTMGIMKFALFGFLSIVAAILIIIFLIWAIGN